MKSLFPTTSASRSKHQQRDQHKKHIISGIISQVIITFTYYYCIVMTLSRVTLSRAFVFPASMKRALPSAAMIGDGHNTATASNKKKVTLMDAANDLATSASTATATEADNSEAATTPPLYLAEGIFAVHKPLTWTCNDVVSYVRNILTRDALSRGVKKERKKRGKPMMKVGHGGTLDPLASGVLVVGIGKGTSKLQSYLEGDKQYTALVELGYETTTLDAEGEIIKTANWDHVSSIESIRETCIPKFTGQIKQLPPLYSAIRVDGKRLYEIARDDNANAAAVDVEIPTRDVHVYNLEVESSLNESVLQSGVVDGRKYKEAVKQMEEAAAAAAATAALEAERTANSSPPPEAETQESDDNEAKSGGKGKNKKRKRDKKNKKKSEKKNLFDESTIPTIQRAQDDAAITTTSTTFDLPLFTLNVSCGGGTYIRSLVRDIGYEMDTVATMTGLVRTKQGPFLLKDVLKREDWNAEKIYEAVAKNKVV
jgi:tRNA pseudouridine55 synthase